MELATHPVAGAAPDSFPVHDDLVEGDAEIGRGARLSAVVDVEPEGLDSDLRFVGSPESDPRLLEGECPVDPTAQRAVCQSGPIELQLPFHAIPLAGLELAGLVPVHSIAVATLLAQVIHVVAETGTPVGFSNTGELHPSRPARCPPRRPGTGRGGGRRRRTSG